MRFALSLFVGMIVFLACTISWAQGETSPAGETALTQLTKLVFEVLTVVLPIVATWLAHRVIGVFENKAQIQVPDAMEAKISTWIEQGIILAAEKSYQKVKDKTDKLKGSEKLELAADFVFDMAQAQGWTQWTKDRIKAKIESAVGAHRANGGVPTLEDKAAS